MKISENSLVPPLISGSLPAIFFALQDDPPGGCAGKVRAEIKHALASCLVLRPVARARACSGDAQNTEFHTGPAQLDRVAQQDRHVIQAVA